MSLLNPVGLAELLDAWRQLQGAFMVEEVAEALGMTVLPSLQPAPSPEPPPVPPIEEGGEPWRDTDPHRNLEPSTVEFDIDHEPPATGTPEKDLAIVADPLGPDPTERELLRPPLFAPRLVRDLVRRTLSTEVVSRSVDTDRLVTLISRGRPLREIPRTTRLSLRRGVQILRDIGESMEPYVEDQLTLVAAIRNLIGESEVEELRCSGVPGPCWAENGRTTYGPPIDGKPILVLSDAGIGRPPDADQPSGPQNWLDFLRRLSGSGSPVVLYLPYRKSRWPQALRTLADAHHWDRPALPRTGEPAVLGHSAGGDEAGALELVLAMQERLPGVVDLATSLALVARVEPALMRRARLDLVPWVGAGGEADLVFSDLVESRSSNCFVLWAPAQRLLQRRLADHPERLAEAAQLLSDFRSEQQAPRSIRVEEEVNRLYCEAWAEAQRSGNQLDTEAMEQAIAPALASLRKGDDQAGLANWALRVDSRFPIELRTTPTAQSLQFIARRQVGAKAIPADLLDESAERLRGVVPTDLARVPIGVRWREDGLVLTDPHVEGDSKIDLPDTHPRVFWLDPPFANQQPGKRWLLDAWNSVHVPAEQLPRLQGEADDAPWPEVWIRTLQGDRWVLKALKPTEQQAVEVEAKSDTGPDVATATSTVLSLEVLSARHGDSFLLHYGTPRDPRLILIDGGPPGVYREVLRPRLDELREERALDDALPIELVVLSHMDDPHARGILDLVGDLVKRRAEGQPDELRIKQLWHNSLERLVSLGVARDRELDSKTRRDRELIDELDRLGLPLNLAFDGGPVKAGRAVDFGGGLRIHVICPTRTGVHPREKSGRDRSIFNLTSLVLLVQSGKRKMLLTADARGDHIVDSLTESGWLGRESNSLHVDVLQLPHQGSDRNISSSFFESITADHYVVTGDGHNGNPDIATFEGLFEARAKDPFTLHLAHHPENYRDGYPISDLLRLFSVYRDRGVRFELRVPAPQATSLLVDLGVSDHLSSRRAQRGVTLATERPRERRAEEPLLNRLRFRELLEQFATPEPRTRVAVVRGPRGSGRTYSWNFVKAAAQDRDVKTVRIDLSPWREDPAGLVSELARQMGFTIVEFPEQPVESSRSAHMLHDRFVSGARAMKSTWWIVIDDCEAAEQVTFEFLVLLMRSLADGSCPNLRLILLGLERDLPSEIESYAFTEVLSPLDPKDVVEYFANLGVSGEELDEMMKRALGKQSGPLLGEELRRLNHVLVKLTDEFRHRPR